ncbi:MAG: CRISPR-associated endonuclease Cas1 [Anaerobutyricum sp.]|nr:CRISPR-associated endonuclease Cas1 [Anaerobutyricum sp.]
MSYLYVVEQGSTIGFHGNRFEVKYKDGMLRSIPSETLEVIEVFGKVQLTTQCIQECMKRGINIIFYSTYGAYFGRLQSSNHVNVARQKQQMTVCQNEELKLDFSKKIINAKIKNQLVILQRYSKNTRDDVQQQINGIKQMRRKIDDAETINQLIGYEGQAAKHYFAALGKLVNPEFAFHKRTRRPPMDPFNSMLSLGYSIILNEIYGKLEGKGLNPYFGLLHRDRENHPTLASDLMEEWRAVLVDSTVLAMTNGNEVSPEDFYSDNEQPGIFLNKDFFKKFVKKLESKFQADNKYLDYIDYRVSFRRALDLQVNQLVKMIESENVEEYHPVMIR